jgi:predicted PurR-regulated permease PerM
VPDWVARLPIAAESTQQWWRANLSDPKAATAWLKSLNAENVSDLFTTFGGQLIHRLFMLFFSLLALFALLRHGRSPTEFWRHAIVSLAELAKALSKRWSLRRVRP